MFLAEQRIVSAWTVRPRTFENHLNCCEVREVEIIITIILIIRTKRLSWQKNIIHGIHCTYRITTTLETWSCFRSIILNAIQKDDDDDDDDNNNNLMLSIPLCIII
jgi:hypothetical protein